MSFNIGIKGIKEGEEIPVNFTCDGENYSPEINTREVPNGTRSLALIVEDPDAPVGMFVHWVIYNIGPDVSTIREKLEKVAETKEGFRQGKNDFGRVGYDGPCPPVGHGYHRYFFKLYALSSHLNLDGTVSRAKLLKVIEGKVLGQAETMGKYKR